MVFKRELEKQIADLEKENRLLGERCNQLLKDKGDLTDKVKNLEEELADYQFNYPTIKELSIENAELRKKLEEADNATDCFNKQEEIIAKANLLLKDVYKIAMGDWNDPKWHDQVLRKAEQFLKEIKENE